DIVHATGGVVPPPGDAALVVTINDLAFLRYPNYFHKRGVAFMTRAFDLAKVHADLVLVPSTYTLEDCVERGLEAERIRVLPLGVTARAVSEQDRAEVRVRYRLPEQFLLWVGTSEPRKNLRALLAALTQSANDLPLLLVGPKGWRTDTDELLADKANVRHLGEVPKADLGVLYDLADVFVYPSLMEGFGLPVLEAMAQRTAVVTSAGTATAEVAGAGAWLVDPNDVASIAAGIDAVVGDSDLRKRLAHAGVQRAAAMSWGSVAEGLAAAYRLVM
ncbi:MAG: glycosyltransferase family 1 protein, partial [Acidimicrobiaceae bacterium]|nr:glycosyltransferase family 1 protein [Acidimicrobiaceae bacterium]